MLVFLHQDGHGHHGRELTEGALAGSGHFQQRGDGESGRQAKTPREEQQGGDASPNARCRKMARPCDDSPSCGAASQGDLPAPQAACGPSLLAALFHACTHARLQHA